MATDLTTAVLCSLDPSFAQAHGISQSAALSVCDELKQNEFGWRYCLEQFVLDVPVQVRFFCLHVWEDFITKHRYDAVGHDQQMLFKSTLMSWCQDKRISSEPVFIKNKFCQILVLLAKIEYPDRWPTFFGDILSLGAVALNSSPTDTGLLDIVLRVFHTVDIEVVNRDMNRTPSDVKQSTMIKDQMRLDCTKPLVELCFGVVSKLANSQNDTDLCKLALFTMASYIEWIDSNTVNTNDVLMMLYTLFKDERLRRGSCQCIKEIVDKGMDFSAKYGLLSRLNLIEYLTSDAFVLGTVSASSRRLTEWADGRTNTVCHHYRSLTSLVDSDDSPAAFAVSVAELVNSVGVQHMYIWDNYRRQEECERDVHRCLQLALGFLACEEDWVAEAVLSLVSTYISVVKHQYAPTAGTPTTMNVVMVDDVAEERRSRSASIDEAIANLQDTHKNCMAQLTRVVCERLRYAVDYDFSSLDEDEHTFSELRHNITRLAPAVVREIVMTILVNVLLRRGYLSPKFVQQLLGTYPSDIKVDTDSQSVDFYDVEAALYMVYLLGEGHGDEVGEEQSNLSQMCSLIFNSTVLNHSHPVVIMSIHELAVRYSGYLKRHPDLLVPVISTFLDARGIQSPILKVRARACYLFQRVVRGLKLELAPYMKAIMSTLTSSLMLHARPDNEQTLTVDEQMDLYEAAGVLIGTDSLSEPEVSWAVECVCNPPLAAVSSILVQRLYIVDDTQPKPIFIPLLSRAISAVSMVSKGFTSENPRPVPATVEQVFFKVCDGVLNALRAVPQNEEVRSAVHVFLHRMVSTLQPRHLFPVVVPAIQGLMSHGTCKDVIEVVRLLNQIIAQLKELTVRFLSDVLPVVMGRVLQLLEMTPSDGSDSDKEHKELKKIFTTLVHTVANGGSTFLSTHISHSLLMSESPSSDNLVQMMSNDPDFQAIKKLGLGYILVTDKLFSVLVAMLNWLKTSVYSDGIDLSTMKACMGTFTQIAFKISPRQDKYLIAQLNKKLGPGAATATVYRSDVDQVTASRVTDFQRFLVEQVAAAAIAVFLAPSFKHTDAAGVSFVDEAFSLLVVCTYRLGDVFLNYLSTVLLPSLCSTTGPNVVNACMTLIPHLEQASGMFADSMTLQVYDGMGAIESGGQFYEYTGLPHSLPVLRNSRTFFRAFAREMQACLTSSPT